MCFYEEIGPTELLRGLCDTYGIPWSTGLYKGGKKVANDKATTVGAGVRSLTFVEDGDTFDCLDGMSVYEAFAAGACAWSEGVQR